MGRPKNTSLLVLKTIGTLFSLAALALGALLIWLARTPHETGTAFSGTGLLVSAILLLAATTAIAIVIWWIVLHPAKFMERNPEL